MKILLLPALTLAVVLPAAAFDVRVTIENLAPVRGTFLTPFWVGFHDGTFDLYDQGAPASPALERLAEDGTTGPLSAAFLASLAGTVDGTIFGPTIPPFGPGENASADFSLDPLAPTSRWFSYASMVIPSNDAFIANGNPTAFRIFADDGTFLGTQFTVLGIMVLDAGTEVNDELPMNTAFFGQMAPNTGMDENGTVHLHPGFLPLGSGGILDDPMFAGADFRAAQYQAARITVGVVPEPGTLAAVLLLFVGQAPAATRYRAGDAVENFTLTDRATRRPVQLADLAGKIVFLEWFAWWCPFCQAAAPQVDAGLVEHYRTRGGNPAGLPVLHVAVNLQGGQEAQTANFVARAGFGLVLEDFNRALANRFQSGGQPIFAIINGVTNSPSHRPWELLLHQDGYGTRDFSLSLAEFRAVIDAVQAPPPEPPVFTAVTRVAERELEVALGVEPGRRVVIEATDDFSQWLPLAVLTNAGPAQVRLPIGPGHRLYRARAE